MKALIAALTLGAILGAPALASAEPASVDSLAGPNARLFIVDMDGRTIATLVSIKPGELRLRTIASTLSTASPKPASLGADLRPAPLTPQQEADAERAAYDRTFGTNHSP